MQHEYVLHRRLSRSGQRDQDTQKKAKNYQPHICEKPVGAES